MRIRLLPAILLLASCDAPDAGVFWPVHEAAGAQQAGLLEGRLTVSRGCVYLVADHGERWLAIWPDRLHPERVGDGPLRIVDERGIVVATEGERLAAGGGEARISELGGFEAFDAWLDDVGGRDPIPRSCGDLTWTVSGIEDPVGAV
jgi:hypothetical protein